MGDHAIEQPCYLKGVSEVWKEKVDCTVKLGSSLFPAHTQVRRGLSTEKGEQPHLVLEALRLFLFGRNSSHRPQL